MKIYDCIIYVTHSHFICLKSTLMLMYLLQNMKINSKNLEHKVQKIPKKYNVSIITRILCEPNLKQVQSHQNTLNKSTLILMDWA